MCAHEIGLCISTLLCFFAIFDFDPFGPVKSCKKRTVEIAQLWQHNRDNYTTPTRPNANFGGGGEKANRRKKKKNEKKNFPPGRGPGFSLIFMKKNFPQNREDRSKKGSKKNFSRSARKGPFISRKYVMT